MYGADSPVCFDRQDSGKGVASVLQPAAMPVIKTMTGIREEVGLTVEDVFVHSDSGFKASAVASEQGGLQPQSLLRSMLQL